MLSKVIAEDKVAQVIDYLEKFDNIVITTHVSPDGDAMGASLGLSNYLKERGVEATVIVPNSFPSFLDWMPGIDSVLNFENQEELAVQRIAEAQLIFCLDFNTLSRIGAVGEYVAKSDVPKIMIDHHPYPEEFCDLTISYPQISSTSEIIFRLICRMGDFELMTKECGECICTGILTDTGGLAYNSNNAEVYYIIGNLLGLGVDKDQIYRKVFNNYTVDRFKLQGYILSEKLKVYEDYNTVMIFLTNEEQARFNTKKGDTEGFSNMPLSIAGIKFSIFFREDGDMIKISLRSVGDFPTNQFSAECFNGGGHLNASGGEFYGKIEDAIKIFETTLPKYISYLK